MFEIYDLRSALNFLQNHEGKIEHHKMSISTQYEMASHFVKKSAGVPASSHVRDEQVILYCHPKGHNIPVLIGLLGSRRRNRLLLTGGREELHIALKRALAQRIAPNKVSNPVCQEVVIYQGIDLMAQLPILKMTNQDAGPYITLGVVLATDPDSGARNISIHRLCVQGPGILTIWMSPGRHLGNFYQNALKKKQVLPVSINIGLDPAVYFASCFTEPLCKEGDCELDIAGGLRRKPVQLSDCIHVQAECLSDAEIVLEGEIMAQGCAENLITGAAGSMPEFLGYYGAPKAKIPEVHVKAITHRKNPIYQTLIGPGKEQSELLAIPGESAIRAYLEQRFDLDLKTIHLSPAGGGLLLLILQIQKHSQEDDTLAKQAANAVLSLIATVKHVILIDLDVDPYSAEDLLWAMTTRFQADQDMNLLTGQTPFLMDPSQSSGYREGAGKPNTCVKSIFDCTAPWRMAGYFKRSF